MSRNHYIIPIFVPHIGCPHNCVFCNQNTITGKKHLKETSEEILNSSKAENIIKEFLKTINNKRSEDAIIEISFFGGTFTAIPVDLQEELLKVAYKYKNSGLIKYIRLSTRPDYIDIEKLSLLKKYSVDIIELGVQSLDEDVLRLSGRGHSEDQVYLASRLIKSFNFTLGIQIMLGLPGDNMKKDILTALKVVEIKPTIARIYPSLVIKDTPMETMLERGDYKPYSLYESINICKAIYSVFVSNNINVVRVGLQPTEDINEDAELVSGPFHPAYRELMESSLLNEAIFSKVLERSVKYKMVLTINPKNISKLYSNKKYYFNKYKDKYDLKELKVIQDTNMSLDEVKINIDSYTYIISYRAFLKEKALEIENPYL
ncbi:elongator complex protein 3 [Hathewaya histolytica]|uniref:elongator complex protein 3 n=1 Tax=Hathewaya histolytica TaxID=1498 RepID=UPI003B682A8B